MEEAERMRRKLHRALGIAFIEIRASDSLVAAKKIADTFHNLPMALMNCSTESDLIAARDAVIARATRNGIDAFVRQLLTESQSNSQTN